MSILKLVLVPIWVLCLVAMIVPGEGAALTLGRRLFFFLVIAHAIECVVFFGRLRRAPGSLAGHLLQTFLFGVVHVRGLPATEGGARPAA
jgi:uncharacterized protein YhhL (DUF1145 family)